MVEHHVDPKSNNVEASVDSKSNIVKTSVDLKSNIDLKENVVKPDVSKLVDNEVDTAKYFFTYVKYKVRDNLINWIHHQASNALFTKIIEISHHGVGQMVTK